MQKERYLEMKQNQEFSKKDQEEIEKDKAIYKNERKRKLKVTETDDENYQNNYQKENKKVKKTKKPRKERIRFQKLNKYSLI